LFIDEATGQHDFSPSTRSAAASGSLAVNATGQRLDELTRSAKSFKKDSTVGRVKSQIGSGRKKPLITLAGFQI
jgi:hypothetical protein